MLPARMSALISVMMPCYNAADRLPMALASLINQSYENWECLLVDDGSTDHFESAIRPFDDPRIRVFRLPGNRGRGYAHAFALEQARGEFLCTLDADDWIYPTKLERQVQFLDQNPEVTAVSLAIALVDEQEQLVGIHFRPGAGVNWLQGIPPRNFCFGAAMLRRQEALRIGYDPSFRRSQDFDFFCRLLEHRTYAILPEVGYAYHFTQGSSLEAVLEGLASNRRFFRSGLWKDPLRYSRQWLLCWVKTCLYKLLSVCGWWEHFQEWRRPSARPEDISDYRSAYQQTLARLGGPLPDAQDLKDR